MRTWAWAVPAVLGLALMMHSYDRLLRVDPEAPWASGFLCIGKGGAAIPLNVGTRISTQLRYLPESALTQAMLKGLGDAARETKVVLEARLRFKLIELPVYAMSLLDGKLSAGRMPEPGKNEVLAGSQAPREELLNIAGRTFKVVGVLQASVGLFADSYLVPKHANSDAIFPRGENEVQPVEVIDLRAADFGNRQILTQVTEAFPRESFAVLVPEVRSGPSAFALYLGGQALFLLGGTGLLIALYRWLSGRVTWPVLAEPLQEIARRPRLIWAVHLVYFGLFVVGAVTIYQLPALHTVLMTAVQGELSSKGNGVLAVAGRAYGSGNMVYAAVVTFIVNFFLGSLTMITLSSMFIPGAGALLAACRATLWGLLLGPSQVTLAYAMMAHSGTLLLEGEGYIMASFFALLIPIYLFGSSAPPPKSASLDLSEFEPVASEKQGSTAWSRFKHAVVLNLKANVLVAIILIVAACYEAFEVISMAGR
jgi:hypothetical protein